MPVLVDFGPAETDTSASWVRVVLVLVILPGWTLLRQARCQISSYFIVESEQRLLFKALRTTCLCSWPRFCLALETTLVACQNCPAEPIAAAFRVRLTLLCTFGS
jgi:hypothetical protein